MKRSALLLLMLFFVGTMHAMSDSDDFGSDGWGNQPPSPTGPRRSPLVRRRKVSVQRENDEQSLDGILGDPHEYPLMCGAAKAAAALGLSYGAYQLWMVCWQSMQTD